ncbi:hypothetical protein ACQ2HG_21615, partial [Aeromonas hydrophila]|uniref:hypothetical protein n=1 Tax=Aeromonas hydrophila TaxID=644 RepID=UPI003D311C93
RLLGDCGRPESAGRNDVSFHDCSCWCISIDKGLQACFCSSCFSFPYTNEHAIAIPNCVYLAGVCGDHTPATLLEWNNKEVEPDITTLAERVIPVVFDGYTTAPNFP